MSGIRLTCRIAAQITDTGTTGLNADNWYPVIGTYNRERQKDGQNIREDLFMILNEETGKVLNIYPSKCKIKRITA